MDLGDLFELLARNGKLIIGLLVAAGWLLEKLLKKPAQPELPEPSRPRRRSAPAGARPKPVAPVKPAPALEARRKLAADLEELVREGANLAEEVEHERANRRFRPVLSEWIPQRAAALKTQLGGAPGRLEPALVQGVSSLSLVLAEVRELVRQRRDPSLCPKLGDADTLADACYQPVITFARAEGLPLSSAYPATQLAPVELSIWTGFAPTSVAPIFLPPRFFEQLACWPALAHEIGHDFLISVRGLDRALREELSLPSEEVGSRPIRLGPEGLDPREVERVLGAWFEELFCDVFGTLMCGPGYLSSMTALFAAREDPREVLLIGVDPATGRYDLHPPRHLRVLASCRVLELAGHKSEADLLFAEWNERHSFPGQEVLILCPIQGRLFGLPLEIYAELIAPLVERLYRGPLQALHGMGLSDIGGLDYGPHQHAEAQRACAALLAGRVPQARDPRAVISGAVFAWRAQPELEPKLLELARAAIPAMGTAERAPDVYAPPPAAARPELGSQTLIEALVLREILHPPRRALSPSRFRRPPARERKAPAGRLPG